MAVSCVSKHDQQLGRLVNIGFAKVHFRVATMLLLAVVALIGSNCRGRKKKRQQAKATTQAPANISQYKFGFKPLEPARPKETLTRNEVKKVLEEARKYTGTPYRYGGASRAGIDCSGLIQVAYAAVGKTMPRPSHQQAISGFDVSIEQAQPGDLIIFHDPPGTISHVGIVTEVLPDKTVKFIHSSSSLGVHETTLKQKYWAQRFKKIHRPQFEAS